MNPQNYPRIYTAADQAQQAFKSGDGSSKSGDFWDLAKYGFNSTLPQSDINGELEVSDQPSAVNQPQSQPLAPTGNLGTKNAQQPLAQTNQAPLAKTQPNKASQTPLFEDPLYGELYKQMNFVNPYSNMLSSFIKQWGGGLV